MVSCAACWTPPLLKILMSRREPLVWLYGLKRVTAIWPQRDEEDECQRCDEFMARGALSAAMMSLDLAPAQRQRMVAEKLRGKPARFAKRSSSLQIQYTHHLTIPASGSVLERKHMKSHIQIIIGLFLVGGQFPRARLPLAASK